MNRTGQKKIKEMLPALDRWTVFLLCLEMVSVMHFLNGLVDTVFQDSLWGMGIFTGYFKGLGFFWVLPAFLSLEMFFSTKILKERWAEILPGLVRVNLPWLLGLSVGVWGSIQFPYPHNILDRKMVVLFGLMWVGHLFLFAGWLLWRCRKAIFQKTSKIIGIVGSIFFIGTTSFTVVCDLSGDEPHYLLMAQSLLKDGDLDLANNYANRDYEAFYHRGALEPQGLEHEIEGKRYSHHPLGTVLLVLPGFLAFGRLGAALTMALLAALTLFLTLRVMEESGSKGWPLLAVAAVGLLSSPVMLFSGLVFPEIPTAFLVALALLLFLRKRWLLMGLCLGAMVWMHNRNVLLVLPFLMAVIHALWKVRAEMLGNLGRLLAGFLPPVLLLAGYFQATYGVLTPLGAHNDAFGSLFRLDRFFIGFFGLLLDQESGLWFHFPIFAMSVMGSVLLIRSRHPLGPAAVWTTAFFFLSMSFYENLGLTPATRYMVGITPILLLMMLPAMEAMKKWDFWSLSTLFAAAGGVLLNWILAAVPWMRYNKLNGENWVLKIAGDFLGLPLCAAQPAFNLPVVEWKSYAIGALWVTATGFMTYWFSREKRIRPAPRRLR